jgi:hypothetical protein
MAEKAFARRSPAVPPTRLNLRQTITDCLRDSIYAEDVVNRSLRNLYGDDLIDDPSSFAARHGIKSAMTVTTVPDTKRRLITNYNGFGTRRKDCGTYPSFLFFPLLRSGGPFRLAMFSD